MAFKDVDGSETPEQLKKLFAEMEDALTYKGSLDNINKERVNDVLVTYQELSDYFKDQKDVKVEYRLFYPSKGMGSASVTGKDIVFNSSTAFVNAANKCDAYEVYAKTDGTVCLEFTFYGLM